MTDRKRVMPSKGTGEKAKGSPKMPVKVKRVPKPVNSLIFGIGAKNEMRRKYLAEKTVTVKNVRGIANHLLLDDRLYCDYKPDKNKPAKSKATMVLYTGYFRAYDPDEETIYVSPYTDSIEMGVSSITNTKTPYLLWQLPNIMLLYIEKDVEKRIHRKVLSRSKSVAQLPKGQ
jgi:hypothetical protein